MLIFVESSNLPLIFVDYMNVEPEYYGLYVLPLFLIYVIGTVISGKYTEKYSEEKIIFYGLVIMIISNLSVLCVFYLKVATPVIIQICKIPCYMGWGFIFWKRNFQNCFCSSWKSRSCILDNDSARNDF